MVRFRLLCGDFLLPNPAPHLENRKTVCMGYPAMTLRRRAGKRRRKGAGKPCRENGAPNINWSKWPVDVVNDIKRHFPEGSSALWLPSCRHFVKPRWNPVSAAFQYLPNDRNTVALWWVTKTVTHHLEVVNGQIVHLPPSYNAQILVGDHFWSPTRQS